jgi:hypothetical protein
MYSGVLMLFSIYLNLNVSFPYSVGEGHSYQALGALLQMSLRNEADHRDLAMTTCDAPSGYVKIAMENGHRNSGFTY